MLYQNGEDEDFSPDNFDENNFADPPLTEGDLFLEYKDGKFVATERTQDDIDKLNEKA